MSQKNRPISFRRRWSVEKRERRLWRIGRRLVKRLTPEALKERRRIYDRSLSLPLTERP